MRMKTDKKDNVDSRKRIIVDKSKHSVFLVVGIILIIVLLVDFINIPSRIGVNIGNFNHEVVSFTFNSITASLVFFLTYYYVEKWNVESKSNKKNVALFVLEETYQNCLSDLNTFHNLAIDYIVNRTDFDKLYNKNSPAYRYAQIAFENEDIINMYAVDGIINSEQYRTYLKIKSDYTRHIEVSIIFFDRIEFVSPKYDELKETIESAICSLKVQ